MPGRIKWLDPLVWFRQAMRAIVTTRPLSREAKIWSMPHVKKVSALKGHTERATDIAFSPVNNHVAIASADRTARLWNSEGTLLRKFEGNLDRLAPIFFHPSGKYLGTTSFDKTLRLWDVENGTELLLQEGHSRSVYGIAFHPDGSMAGPCGLDARAPPGKTYLGKSTPFGSCVVSCACLPPRTRRLARPLHQVDMNKFRTFPNFELLI